MYDDYYEDTVPYPYESMEDFHEDLFRGVPMEPRSSLDALITDDVDAEPDPYAVSAYEAGLV